MPREFKVEHPCEMAAERFWALRVDEGFDHYSAELDNQVLEMQQFDETTENDGRTTVARAYTLKLKENPVPPRLRGLMGGKGDLAFTVRAHFDKYKFDEAHPYSYSSTFPVFTDRITVTGKQWCVPVSADRCIVHAKIRLQVNNPVVGPAVEKAVEKGISTTYRDLPIRALEYIQLTDEQVLHWRTFRGGPFPLRSLGGTPPAAPSPAERTAEDEDAAAALPPPPAATPPPPAVGVAAALEAAAGCLAPQLKARMHLAERSCERLEAEVMALQAQLKRRDSLLAQKEQEIDGLTNSLRMTILQLKAASEISSGEREKHRKEERRREELRAHDEEGARTSSVPADVQQEAEREAWVNREKALRQQLEEMGSTLSLQQKLLHEQIEMASTATARANQAKALLAAHELRLGTEEPSLATQQNADIAGNEDGR
ncbi:hypothetical protein AB1Y20_001721 [Prymnesium parvum]|uniref:Uncharacterized protein n=1 Tax=Prymnesium parvum TaxID=97485 RepID=A0AB34K9G5_PRYPA